MEGGSQEAEAHLSEMQEETLMQGEEGDGAAQLIPSSPTKNIIHGGGLAK